MGGLVVVIRKASAKGRHGRGSRCKGSEAGQCSLCLRSGKGAKQAREGNEESGSRSRRGWIPQALCLHGKGWALSQRVSEFGGIYEQDNEMSCFSFFKKIYSVDIFWRKNTDVYNLF